MSERVPVNPGRVEWAGNNPGIYLRDSADGPWTALAVYFHIVLSPRGRGRTMIVLGEPDRAEGLAANNVCLTDNHDLTRYLLEGFVSKFPSFRGKAGLDAMSWHDLERVHIEDALPARYTMSAAAPQVQAVMTLEALGEPFPVEVTPETSATGAHDMYSVFLEAKAASIAVNGTRLRGRVTDRQFFGKTMSTAFLALSETWVSPLAAG